MEGLYEQVMSTLAFSLGGVSLGAVIIGLWVLVLRIKRTSISKDHIEQAFKNAVLPSEIKINLSNKIMPVIEQMSQEVKKSMLEAQGKANEELTCMKEQVKLVLTILSQLNHVEKLTKEQKNAIQTILKNDTSVDVQV
jgi:flavodoxin